LDETRAYQNDISGTQSLLYSPIRKALFWQDKSDFLLAKKRGDSL
jgi:hypothetical protein